MVAHEEQRSRSVTGTIFDALTGWVDRYRYTAPECLTWELGK
jgi:hypothetical protein